jgi:hypothetical protein
MSKLTFQDFVHVYTPSEGQTYQCGRVHHQTAADRGQQFL